MRSNGNSQQLSFFEDVCESQRVHNYAWVYIETGEPVSPDTTLGALQAAATPAADVMLLMEIYLVSYRFHELLIRHYLEQRCVCTD